MKTHFRIIELPSHQVLLTKDFDQETDDTPVLNVTFFLEGVKINQKFAYHDEEKRDEHFDKFTDEQAQGLVDSCIKLFEGGE